MFTSNPFSSFLSDAVTAPLPADDVHRNPSVPSNSVLDEIEHPSASPGSLVTEQGSSNDTDSGSPSTLIYVGLETNTYEALFKIVSEHATIL